MAKQGTTNATPKVDGHKHEGQDQDCTNVTFGPFGDKHLHGSTLVYDTSKSDPNKRKPEDKLKADVWCFCYWVPGNTAEVERFTKAKPDNVRALISDALKAEARFSAWHENRGGTTTTRVSVDGAEARPLPNTIIDLLRAAGHKVVEVPKDKD